MSCVDESYRFAKEFNQELGLRLKLWNEGFMADLKQLPGLTAQERDSISTYLKILFRMYFHPKEGLNIESNSKKLFDLCSKVMKDYCLQQSELVSIMNSKREESSLRHDENSRGEGIQVDDHMEEDTPEKNHHNSMNQGKITASLSNLHEKELQK